MLIHIKAWRLYSFVCTLSLSCRFIRKYWTYKMLVRYFVFSMCLRWSHLNSFFFFANMGLCIFNLAISLVMIVRIWVLYHYYHQIGSRNHWPLFSSWNSVMDHISYRGEPLNEAHDSTFGILENYHCWRFHGSGVIVALQSKRLIFFCTDMHHEYFFLRLSMCFRVPHLCSKIPKIYN